MIPSPVHLFETQQVLYEKPKASTGLGSISLPTLWPVRMPEQETLAVDVDPPEPPTTALPAV